MKVQLVRRWGSHKAGTTVDVNEREGEWLVARRLGVEVREQERVADVAAPVKRTRRTRTAAAEGGVERRARRSTRDDVGAQ